MHALDEHTLRLDLEHPAPYLLNLIAGRTWYPVYLPAIEKTGALGRPREPALDPA